MLVFEVFCLSLAVRCEGCLQALAVIRMDTGKPALDAVVEFVLMTAEHGFPARRKIDVVCASIPIPQPVVRSPHSQRVSLFAVPEGLFGLLACQLGMNAGKSNREINGFGDVVVGPQTQRRDNVLALILGTHHDDGELCRGVGLADHFEHCDAIEYGHHDVEQDKIKPVLPKQSQGLVATRRRGGRIAMTFEAAAQQIAVIFVVIHDQERTKRRDHMEALLSVKTLPFTVRSSSVHQRVLLASGTAFRPSLRVYLSAIPCRNFS